ncbi:MAG: hypothetical protein HOP31_03545 [Ignavibacteria bacterium]|nr:hypothetical protein [Ignavibacteria bacterium]
MKYLLSIVLAAFLFTLSASAQDLNIAISYLYGEKSKDSHASEESFAVSYTSVAYSVKYSGRKGKNQVDMEKTCTFTEQDINNIRKTIETKGLNVNDSLESKMSKTKNFEIFTRINIAIIMDGNEYKINISGDTIEFDDAKLYKNSVFFITMLRKMVEDCK